MPGMVFTPSRFNVFCSRLSSVDVVLCTAFFFLNGAIQTALIEDAPRSRHQHPAPRAGAAPSLGKHGSAAYLRTEPFPPVRTAPAIRMSFSRSILPAPLIDTPKLDRRRAASPGCVKNGAHLIPKQREDLNGCFALWGARLVNRVYLRGFDKGGCRRRPVHESSGQNTSPKSTRLGQVL